MRKHRDSVSEGIPFKFLILHTAIYLCEIRKNRALGKKALSIYDLVFFSGILK